jgi:branched-chain amino acid transport system substrate-binding protein
MVGWGLLVVGVISAAAFCATTARAEIRIGVAGPMTGAQSWFGEQFERGARMAAADLNGKGGVLGQTVELVVGDDFCDPDQAVAAANKLVADGVVFVVGHWCSHSSIAASTVYEEAQVLMITPGSASAKLTDEGGANVFRVYGRDDRQGAMVGDYLAERWADKEIAILDDGTTWGAGVSNGVRRRLRNAAFGWPWMRPSPGAKRSIPSWSRRCRPRVSMSSSSAASTRKRA